MFLNGSSVNLPLCATKLHSPHLMRESVKKTSSIFRVRHFPFHFVPFVTLINSPSPSCEQNLIMFTECTGCAMWMNKSGNNYGMEREELYQTLSTSNDDEEMPSATLVPKKSSLRKTRGNK
jgi:hypothetical protein